ncbi:MAG: DUF3781 domain-containing protein [Christensenellaceae bacterium]|jgi:hypothetical protein
MKAELRKHMAQVHTTALGEQRIKRNMALAPSADVVAWCKEKIRAAESVARKGKNYYVYTADAVLTVNAHSYTVITAHKVF